MAKRCCCCKKIKDITDFNKNRSSKDGFGFECRECSRKNKRESYLRNRKEISRGRKEEYHANLEKYRKEKRDYAARNRESELSRAKEWYKKNKDRKREYDKEYSDNNREKRREASKRHRGNHPKRKRADTALRRAQRIKATPKWVDREELKRVYENCPKGYHVDHIIPLRGKKVCGLHVPWNLQYLEPKDNLKKSNHYSWGE